MEDYSSFSPDQQEEQDVQYIPLDSLILWTENPRDEMDPDSDNETIIVNALNEPEYDQRWKLKSLAKEMGDDYDFSELPTVVKVGNTDKYQVYDGNRRVILAMLKHRGWPIIDKQFSLPFFPESIPCNVCSKRVALRHVYRKHNEAGTWKPYERDLFAYKYMGEAKSVLLRIEELCDAITTWPQLNQRFVREDVLNTKHLLEIGLDPDQENYGVPEEILKELIRFIANEVDSDGLLSTRKHRNDPKKVIPKELLSKIGGVTNTHSSEDHVSGFDPEYNDPGNGSEQEKTNQRDQSPSSDKKEGGRRTPATSPKKPPLFSSEKGLSLRSGDTNNLYRTLEELWQKNEKGEIRSNIGFVAIFRMGLRLLVETAADDLNQNLDTYVSLYASDAKGSIPDLIGSRDILTYLSSQSVAPNSLTKLLQTGAHSYTASNNREQALAMSILIGAMLLQSHGKYR